MNGVTKEVRLTMPTAASGEVAGIENITVFVEARPGTGEQEVSSRTVEGMKAVLDGIQAVSGAVADTVRAVRPDRFSVELGFEVKSEAGGLAAMLVRAGGSATIKVTLEWDASAATVTGG